MKFRPCIDLHEGRVKQLVGKTLAGRTEENFISEHGAEHYAQMFCCDRLYGGHVIMLGAGNEKQALSALNAFPGGLQIGGGINESNAEYHIKCGASHIIITSAMFNGISLSSEAILRLKNVVGKENLVIDLSCVRIGERYFAAKDGWRTVTDLEITSNALSTLSEHCSEFLIHAIDVEGQKLGPDYALIALLSDFRTHNDTPITYAGGISKLEDIIEFERVSAGLLDFTIGSALDIYGGTLPYVHAAQYR